MKKQPPTTTEAFEKALQDSEQPNSEQPNYVLRLYIAGNTPTSVQAIMNLRKICEERLKGRYQLEVIDIRQQPELARKEQLIAVPTLIKKLPLPLRKMIGDLSKTERILVGLDLDQAE